MMMPPPNPVSEPRKPAATLPAPMSRTNSRLLTSGPSRAAVGRRRLLAALDGQQLAVLPGGLLLDRLDVDGHLQTGQGGADGLLDLLGEGMGLPDGQAAGHEQV